MAEGGMILIAGRSGRVARALAKEAERLRLPVRALGRPQFDIENPDSIARTLDAVAPAAIVNTAGLVAVDEAERNPDLAYRINRDGAANLAGSAARAGIPLIHLSSDYVFDGEKGAPYREDDPAKPISVYGLSKLAGEQAVLAAHPASIVIRTSWVYGPHGTNFVTTMLRLARTETSVRVVFDQRGTPTLDADLSGAVMEITTKLLVKPARHAPGIYHVAGDGDATWLDVAQALFAEWARRGHRVPRIEPVAVADWPGLARRPRDTRLDCSKVMQAFGVRLPPWRQSLERSVGIFSDRGED